MKKTCFISAGLVLLGLILYLLAGLSTHTAEPLNAAVSVQAQPPAPYPQDFEQRLARMSSMKIELHADSDAPPNIPWETADEFPEIGSPLATKGGTLRLSNVGPFPANFLAFGSPAPQFFHYNLFERIDVPLVRAHPDTGQPIPGLAEYRALHKGMLWFKLNPAVRYSNGRPLRAADFALGVYLREQVGDITAGHLIEELHVYGDGILAVKPRKSRVLPFITASAVLHPAEPGFYAEFGSDYQQRYQNRIPPTTGAYTVGKVQRGRLITLVRNDSWWAEELDGFRYTCNADCIEHHFLTDEAQAWEMFLRGKLDTMQTRNIVAWQEYLNNADERIVQQRFEVIQPMPPYGIALNASALTDLNLRRGLLQAMDMQHAMQIIFRGEAERLPQFTCGYRHLNHSTPQYQYNPEQARSCFAAAGYTIAGADGILQRPDGTRLSIRLAYTPNEKVNTLVTLLAQSAAACGAEIVAEPLPWQNCAELVKKKQHHMLFWATMHSCPLPDYRRFFHSAAQGEDAPFCLADEQMDAAIERCEQAQDITSAAKACANIDKLIYESAIWLPGWMENRVNIAHWPHVHFPQGTYTTYDLVESHTYWISN